jgi:hypothetical protein
LLEDLLPVLEVPDALEAFRALVGIVDTAAKPDAMHKLLELPRDEFVRETFRIRTALSSLEDGGQEEVLTRRQWCQRELELIADENEDNADLVLEWATSLTAKHARSKLAGVVLKLAPSPPEVECVATESAEAPDNNAESPADNTASPTNAELVASAADTESSPHMPLEGA